MAATKKKKKPQRDEVEIIGVKKERNLRPARRQKRSKYEQIVDAASRLKPGEVLEISIPNGADADETRNRISAAVRRKAQPLTDYTLRIKMTENGTVGIYCKRE